MGKHYLFGWGSYVNPRRVDHLVNILETTPVRVDGMRRAWGVREKSLMLTVLGGYFDENSRVNGLLYEISEDDYTDFVERKEKTLEEVGLVRFDITPEKVSFINEAEEFDIDHDSKIVTYIHHTDIPVDEEYPIGKSYVDVVIDGILDYGDNFIKEYIETTSGWTDVMDDIENPRYKKASGEKRTEEINKTLDKYNIKVK